MSECEGCYIGEENCLHLAYKEEDTCPCRTCIVKVMCEKKDCDMFVLWSGRWKDRYWDKYWDEYHV